MNGEKETLVVDEEPVFYYAECPHCGFKFAVSPFLSKVNFESTIEIGGVELRDLKALVPEDDFARIFCPFCGRAFTLTVAKTPKVQLVDISETFAELKLNG